MGPVSFVYIAHSCRVSVDVVAAAAASSDDDDDGHNHPFPVLNASRLIGSLLRRNGAR